MTDEEFLEKLGFEVSEAEVPAEYAGISTTVYSARDRLGQLPLCTSTRGVSHVMAKEAEKRLAMRAMKNVIVKELLRK